MAKKKQKRYYNDLERDGFVLVPETTGVILDGIYHNEDRQELAVRWMMRTLIFRPIDTELTLNKSGHDSNARVDQKNSIKMTPSEKANEFLQRFYHIFIDVDSYISAEIMISLLSIKSAIICVDQIICANPNENPLNNDGPKSTIDYWLEVKKELEEM